MLNMIHNEAELFCFVGHEVGHQTLNHCNRWEQKSERRNLQQREQDDKRNAQSNKIQLSEESLAKRMKHPKNEQELEETIRELEKLEEQWMGEYKKQVDEYKKHQEEKEFEQSGWSKELEIEADRFGADIASKAGYDTYALCELFERLSKKIEDDAAYRQRKLTAAHPALAERASELRKYLKAKGCIPGQGITNKESYIEAMSELAKIRTGETLEKARMKVEQFFEQLDTGIRKRFIDEIIFQDAPDWSDDSGDMPNPQNVMDAIDNALLNVENWHKEYGVYLLYRKLKAVAEAVGRGL